MSALVALCGVVLFVMGLTELRRGEALPGFVTCVSGILCWVVLFASLAGYGAMQ